MLHFAYDGSLYGDWLAHYAVRLAAHSEERRLHLVHVRDASRTNGVLERIDRIRDECRVFGVTLEPELVSGADRVAEVLLERVPSGAEHLLVCGTRARARNLAFLAGTVSARLLARGRCSVVAFRVVSPGILGQPGRLLLPFAGHPRGASFAIPLLRRFGADLEQLHVLFVREVSRLRFRALSAQAAEGLLAEGRAFALRLEQELRDALGEGFELDASVVVSDDLPKEILVHAGKLRSRLICLGASERSLPERLVYGNPIEVILRDAPCDVAIYRSID